MLFVYQHNKHTYISEQKIWDQFNPASNIFSITKEMADDITNALNETFEKSKQAIKKQMEGYRIKLKELEKNEDEIYEDFKRGILRDDQYQRRFKKIRDERDDYTTQL